MQNHSMFVLVLALLAVLSSAHKFGHRFRGHLHNYIVNGKFKIPHLHNEKKWDYLPGGTTGWQAAVLEVGKGSVYNSKWGHHVQVIELDSTANQVVAQTLTTLTGCQTYNLSFKWAARAGHIESSAGVCKWNGVTIAVINPTDLEIHKENIQVVAQDGSNVLEFSGTSASDSYGLTIGDVKLVDAQLYDY